MFNKKNKSIRVIDADPTPPTFIEMRRDSNKDAIYRIELLSSHLCHKVDNFEYHSQTNIDGKVI